MRFTPNLEFHSMICVAQIIEQTEKGAPSSKVKCRHVICIAEHRDSGMTAMYVQPLRKQHRSPLSVKIEKWLDVGDRNLPVFPGQPDVSLPVAVRTVYF